MKTLLQPNNFRFLGWWRYPGRVGGQFPAGASTAYSRGGFTLYPGPIGERWFDCVGADGVGGAGSSPIYRFLAPDVSALTPDVQSAPTADVVQDFGQSLYGDPDIRNTGHPVTYGLRWDNQNSRLHWWYDEYYQVTGERFPTYAYTQFADDGSFTVAGPWRCANVPDHRVRGGSIAMPNVVAFGYGGNFSGYGACSQGPCLWVPPWDMPTDGSDYSATPLLDYQPPYFAPRDSNYSVSDQLIGWGAKQPNASGGNWSPIDTVGGCTYLETATHAGVLFCCSLGIEHVWYQGGFGMHADGGLEPVLYLYNPDDLLAVSRGELQSFEPKPIFWRPAEPISDKLHGIVWEHTVDGNDYMHLLDAAAWFDGYEWHPGVLVYQVVDQLAAAQPRTRSVMHGFKPLRNE